MEFENEHGNLDRLFPALTQLLTFRRNDVTLPIVISAFVPQTKHNQILWQNGANMLITKRLKSE